jgi:hypothetical protein
MGGSWLTVVARGGALMAVSHREHEYVLEKASSGLLETLSGWPLEPQECAGVLLGDVPARLGLSAAVGAELEAGQRAGAQPERDVEVFLSPAENGRMARRYVYTHGSGGEEDGPILRIETDEQLFAEITYTSWSHREGHAVPAHLRLRDRRGTLALQLLSLAEGTTPGAFELSPPEGFQRRTVPEQDGSFPYWGDPEPGS